MAIYKEPADRRLKPRCMMCEGDLDSWSIGSICNTCKDKMRKSA